MPATTIKPAAPAAVLPASAQTISRRRLLTAAGSAALLTAGAALTPKPVRAAAVGSKTLRIAALPAIDALILYAAEADGIFKSEGLNIEILPFKSSVEMTAAIRAEKSLASTPTFSARLRKEQTALVSRLPRRPGTLRLRSAPSALPYHQSSPIKSLPLKS